ncbi:MAG TPA: DUF2784 domain-containing protein [Thermoanaerobaculia bacterium]|nr:DUF2784 domain-containing protein [Thermoanaerobaculia bacterium]
MVYHVLANATALVHLGFILFVLFGGFVVLKWPRAMWLHIPAAIWGVMIEFAGWYCPLTRWENHFLRSAGKAGYSEGFISHYIFSLIYPSGLTRGIEIALGAIVLLLNAGIYMKVFR